MNEQDAIDKIRRAFGSNEYPGDHFLQGSREGSEPFEEVSPFVGRLSWEEIAPDLLDAHGAALSFFSEAGFRFFMPAFLIADLAGQLNMAEPLFHLTGGFFDLTIKIPVKGREFMVRSGKTAMMNPRRLGALTFYDYARYRLSVFTREEAGAIVAYLQCRRDGSDMEHEQEQIDAALNAFWLERARSAPTAADLERHLTEKMSYLEALNEA
jgi:hypothetical protein